MSFVFGNPWGLLGLLGVPVLVLIYFLRRKAKVEVVTTLFLLKRLRRESKGGRRFEKLERSIPFWLQLLAVLLLTWILSKPKFGNERAMQQVAVIVDSSASMLGCRNQFGERLGTALREVAAEADHSVFYVLDHDARRSRMYQGENIDELLMVMEGWDPKDGARDPRQAIRIGRSLVGPGGRVIYVTDHAGGDLPLGCERLAVGSGLANCGFTGVEVTRSDDGWVWSAMVRNYGDGEAKREWVVETLDGRRTEPRGVVIGGRSFVTLRGVFPEGVDRCVLRLSDDEMGLDDVVPIVKESPRVARLEVLGGGRVVELGDRMVEGFEHVGEAGEVADLRLGILNLDDEVRIGTSGIYFSLGGQESPRGRILMGESELLRGLNFQALKVAKVRRWKVRQGDEVLLWMGEVPLIFVRTAEDGLRSLVFGFSLDESNALKLPGVAVLLHRFCELVAKAGDAKFAMSVDTGQLLSGLFPTGVSGDRMRLVVRDLKGGEKEMELGAEFRRVLRAPREPSFLELDLDGERLAEIAVQFGDTREADLSRAGSVDLPEREVRLAELRTRGDWFWRWFGVGVLVLSLVAWYYLGSDLRGRKVGGE